MDSILFISGRWEGENERLYDEFYLRKSNSGPLDHQVAPHKMSHTCEVDHKAMIRPRGYKTFFMLNSAEHEILNAHKHKHYKKFGFY